MRHADVPKRQKRKVNVMKELNAYFKSIIDGMQLSNIPVPFNTDLLERLNQGIYAKNIFMY